MSKIIVLLYAVCFVTACTTSSPSLKTEALERVTQTLVKPPLLPLHEQKASGQPKIVQVRLVAEEKEIQVAEDAFVQAMTFNGSVPGPIIVAHEGDYIELTLVNPSESIHPHNIDLHAATGALGGGKLTLVKPGEEATIRFKAIKAGVFVYHCAPGGAMIPYHVVTGMNGAIMILPRDGLKDDHGLSVFYDKAYYIGEQDLYIPKDEEGEYRRFASINDAFSESFAVMQGLVPSHVVFNGKVNALTGDNALKASVGENVLFIHSQANRDSRPHLIGGHADLVWLGGSFNDRPLTNQETWFVPGGSAVAALYQFKQPGSYVYLNHNLIEAIQMGAAAHVKVDGHWDDDLMRKISFGKIKQ